MLKMLKLYQRMRLLMNHHSDSLEVMLAYIMAVTLSSINEALGAISLCFSIAFTGYKFYQTIKNNKKTKDDELTR
jgi:Na+/H+ antiporter NhaB